MKHLNPALRLLGRILAVILTLILLLSTLTPALQTRAFAAGGTALHVLQEEALALSSTRALLIRLDDGATLLDMGADERIYPASMTKIMTALLVAERMPDLSRQVRLRPSMFDYIERANASTAGFLPGERVRAEDLLYGVLLCSGAECVIGLAEAISGTEPEFVELMNRRARQLGMTGTHFSNACGLHTRDNYTTARDMALLLEYALQNETFYRVFTAQEHVTAATDLHPSGLRLPSTLFAKAGPELENGGTLLGGKTGYTHAAGQCLASVAEKDGVRYLLVTAGAYPEDYRTQNLHIDDALAVYNALQASA